MSHREVQVLKVEQQWGSSTGPAFSLLGSVFISEVSVMKYLRLLRKLCLVETRRWLLMMGLVAVTYLSLQSLLLPYGEALRSLLANEKTQMHYDLNLYNKESSLKSSMICNPHTVQALNVSNASMGGDNGDGSVINQEYCKRIERNGKGVEDLELSSVVDVGQLSVSGKMVAVNDRFESNSIMIRKSNVLDSDKEAGNGFHLEPIVGTNGITSVNDNDGFAIVQEVQQGREENGKRNENENTVASDVKMFNEDPEISMKRAFDISSASVSMKNQKNSYTSDSNNVATNGFRIELIVSSNGSTSTRNDFEESENLSSKTSEGVNGEIQSPFSSIVETIDSVVNIKNFSSNESTSFWSSLLDDNVTNTTQARKKMKCEMPPKTVTSIDEMNRILVRHRRSSRAMKPKWSSVRDQEILAAKSQIENPPVVRNDPELYAPLFRNVSMFKRSYELMERTLKVYVYKEGNKPIFHQPILKGLYASEGWFMKLMEGNKIYAVQDPRKAHLFYMPFSSRMLEHMLYVHNSHNRTNLRQYMKDYSERISAKYPYFNRTGGADHFLVACHDWAPYETRHHMERCMKALCNADVTIGFKIGRDVSFPETYVRSGKNPQRDLGGKPPSQRHIFAFYAGNMHGYLRPILLKYWKDKDPDMKILGPMPPGVSSKMSYIEHMKSSKYCICPKGYEVNSPRVVEAIFYECVPVIISDNFVPPFFDVLDWSAFSVIMAERDIPQLKEILASIPEEKYLEMQLRVKKIQKHFLWHAKPLKYDLFYMTLHSIWYNRVFQIKLK